MTTPLPHPDAGQQQEVPSHKPHIRRVSRVLHCPVFSDVCLVRSAHLAAYLFQSLVEH